MDRRLQILLNEAEGKESCPVFQDITESIGYWRQNAIEYLLFLSDSFCVEEGSVVHAFILLDRFMSSSASKSLLFSNSKLIPAAVACFMISVKLRETHHPTLSDLQKVTSLSCKALSESEENVMTCLEWNVLLVSGSKIRIFRSIVT